MDHNGHEEVPEFGTPRDNEERRDGGCGIVFDPDTGLFAVGKQHENGSYRLFSGGVTEDEDLKQGILREVIEESGLHDFAHIERIGAAVTHYFNTLRKVNRVAHATCYLVILNSTDTRPVSLEEHEKFDLAWATADDIVVDWESRNQEGDNDHWLYFFRMANERLTELGHL